MEQTTTRRGFLAFLTVVSIGAWIYGTWGTSVSSGRSRLLSLTAAVALAIVGGRMFLVTEIAESDPVTAGFQLNPDFSEKIPWQPFSDENVAKLRKAGKPGFIDFTADW